VLLFEHPRDAVRPSYIAAMTLTISLEIMVAIVDLDRHMAKARQDHAQQLSWNTAVALLLCSQLLQKNER
jgi:hypothetical protein